jgi:hypothetical protein
MGAGPLREPLVLPNPRYSRSPQRSAWLVVQIEHMFGNEAPLDLDEIARHLAELPGQGLVMMPAYCYLQDRGFRIFEIGDFVLADFAWLTPKAALAYLRNSYGDDWNQVSEEYFSLDRLTLLLAEARRVVAKREQVWKDGGLLKRRPTLGDVRALLDGGSVVDASTRDDAPLLIWGWEGEKAEPVFWVVGLEPDGTSVKLTAAQLEEAINFSGGIGGIGK